MMIPLIGLLPVRWFLRDPGHWLALRVRPRPPTAAYARSALTVRSAASAILRCETIPRRCPSSATEIAGTISEPPLPGPKGEIHGRIE
jgi:hypothetical protein